MRETGGRFNLDLRMPAGVGAVRAFIEGDCAGSENTFRLRHAYGQWKGLRLLDPSTGQRSARAPEPGDVVRICRALNEAGARYLLIGGFALIAHGAGRFTQDIDLLGDDTPENVARVRRALSVLPDNAAAEIADDDVRRHVVVRVADEVVVDLMGRACGVTYADAAADAETLEREDVLIPVASPAMAGRSSVPRSRSRPVAGSTRRRGAALGSPRSPRGTRRPR